MVLDIGNIERSESPTAEQVRHFLRFMPPHSPFVILSAREDFYMQTTPEGSDFRVEYAEAGQRFFTHVPVEKADQLFEAFRAEDQSFRNAVTWRRLTFFNTPRLPVSLRVFGLFLVAFVIWGAWQAFNVAREIARTLKH